MKRLSPYVKVRHDQMLRDLVRAMNVVYYDRRIAYIVETAPKGRSAIGPWYDFVGMALGTPIAFLTKPASIAGYIYFSDVSAEQSLSLNVWDTMSAPSPIGIPRAFVLVEMPGPHYYAVPWTCWTAQYVRSKQGGRVGLGPNTAHDAWSDFEVFVSADYPGCLDYLGLLGYDSDPLGLASGRL